MWLYCGEWAGEKAKGPLSVFVLNRNPEGRLGCLQELVDASRGSWWGVGEEIRTRCAEAAQT
jgi:hypothetical protein